MPAFDAYGLEADKTGIFFGTTGCAPLIADVSVDGNEICRQEIERAASYIQQNVPKEVFLVAEWKEGYSSNESTNSFYLSTLLSHSIDQLPKETQISILLRIPTYPQEFFRDHFFLAERESVYMTTQFPRDIFVPLMEHINVQILQEVSEYENVRILNPLDTMCDDSYCYRGSDEGLYYSDSSHLSVTGAIQIILPLLLNREE